jgi:hypothetical protein
MNLPINQKPGAWISWWSAAVGAMDACTGLLLIFAPAMTLKLMGLSVPTEVLPYQSWIGAFVLSTGLAYGWAIRHPANDRDKGAREMVWKMTALVRILIALFLTSRILTGGLSAGWSTVAATDAVVALVQWVALKRRVLS